MGSLSPTSSLRVAHSSIPVGSTLLSLSLRLTYWGDGALVELWVTIGLVAKGYDPNFPDKYFVGTTNVLIEDLAPVCGAAEDPIQAAMARSRGRLRSALRAALRTMGTPVQSTCKGCCTKDLTPLDPADQRSVQMESGYDPWYWLLSCTAAIQTATPCFKNEVIDRGGTFILTNTVRTAWYQKHFYEIYSKHQDLATNQDPACAAIKQKVAGEMAKHQIAREPAKGVNPRHVNGEAIDIGTKKSGLSLQDRDAAADTCGLYRRVPDDLVHYEVKPQP